MECWTRSRCYELDRSLFGAATRARGFLLTRGIHLKQVYGIVQGTDPFIPEKFLQGDEIWLLYLVFQELEPVHGDHQYRRRRQCTRHTSSSPCTRILVVVDVYVPPEWILCTLTERMG